MNNTNALQSTEGGRDARGPGMDRLRKLAWGYTLMFLFVASLNYIAILIPALKDSQGRLCGLFTLDWWDDALHLGSAIWAAVAAWRSPKASLFYFRAFGVVYFLDGVVGLLFGNGYLDLAIITFGPVELPLITRIAANAPHLAIGGLAIFIGFVLSRQIAKQARQSP